MQLISQRREVRRRRPVEQAGDVLVHLGREVKSDLRVEAEHRMPVRGGAQVREYLGEQRSAVHGYRDRSNSSCAGRSAKSSGATRSNRRETLIG